MCSIHNMVSLRNVVEMIQYIYLGGINIGANKNRGSTRLTYTRRFARQRQACLNTSNVICNTDFESKTLQLI